MSPSSRRLLIAGITAACLHITLLFLPITAAKKQPPNVLPIQQITVSLGTRPQTPKQSPKKPVEKKHQTIVRPRPTPPTVNVKPKSALPKKTKKKPRKTATENPLPAEHKSIKTAKEKTRPTAVKTVNSQTSQTIQAVPPTTELIHKNQLPNGDSFPEKTQPTTVPAKIIQKATPLYQRNPAPKYPRLAKRRGYEGQVLLEALIDTNGLVKKLKIIKGSGYSILDKAAEKAVQRWLFRPGTIGDRIVEMRVQVPVRFRLK